MKGFLGFMGYGNFLPSDFPGWLIAAQELGLSYMSTASVGAAFAGAAGAIIVGEMAFVYSNRNSLEPIYEWLESNGVDLTGAQHIVNPDA